MTATADISTHPVKSDYHVLDAIQAYSAEYTAEKLVQELTLIEPVEVRRHLQRSIAPFSLERLKAFISPAAQGLLGEMAEAAHALTLQRFGRTMMLYAPIYVSNLCCNQCRYCGFNVHHKIVRRNLSIEEVVAEGRLLAKEGFQDLLLVAGEDPRHASIEYFEELVPKLKEIFSTVSIEIYPLEEEGYRRLAAAGVEGMTLYQETYCPSTYEFFHPAGPKSFYANRLKFQENAARAGMRRLGLGALLGLQDWRFETIALGLHARALMQNYWQSKVSFSFPRIQPAQLVDLELPAPVTDKDLVQMMLALRLCFPDAGLTLSTRESAELRNHLIPLGITQMSAGSCTAPGGYQSAESTSAQFEVADERTPAEVAELLDSMGYEPVWKDWDQSF
jgi:2-iminoacetate synthase